jgi:hypothetical protein
MTSPTNPNEGCTTCGRATLVGSPLFSDRLATRADDGSMTYLCADCNERAVTHFGRRPGERDLDQIGARASGLGMASGHGGMSSGSGGG